jgi:hypothetical protein
MEAVGKRRFSIMLQKTKVVSCLYRVNCGSLPLCYTKKSSYRRKQIPSLDQYQKCFIEKQGVIDSNLAGWRKNAGGGEMKVSSIMLLKTHVEKMSVLRLSIMLMKRHEL